VVAKPIFLTGAAIVALSGVVLAAAPRSRVALRATPPAQTVARGESARFALELRRATGYGRAANLYVSDLPRGVHVAWELPRSRRASGRTPAAPQIVVRRGIKLVLGGRAAGTTLILSTSGRTPLGTLRPLVSARGKQASAKLRLRLTVTPPAPPAVVVDTASDDALGLSGAVAGPLRPGTSQPLELTISNPFAFDVRLTKLDVAVKDGTGRPGCDGAANYTVLPATISRPLVLPPGSARLDALIGAEALPRVAMLNLPVNQDACKGAQVRLELSASAER
jgi:hypothetical protein